MLKIHWCQLLKCKCFLVFTLFNDGKFNIFGILTVFQNKTGNFDSERASENNYWHSSLFSDLFILNKHTAK